MDKSENEVLQQAYETATGTIRYNMMNDYMFRMILQKNEFVLRGLIGSLLHLNQDEIKSIVITNPIKPGEQIDSKTFILDIHITMNDDTLLDIEMQVMDQGDTYWHFGFYAVSGSTGVLCVLPNVQYKESSYF